MRAGDHAAIPSGRPPQPTLLFWAKRRTDQSESAYHPLLCHMVDVADVAQVMWQEVLSPAARCRIAQDLGAEEDLAGRWLALWAGLHDIGKASPAFQGKDDSIRDMLCQAGLPCPARAPEGHHGAITSSVLPAILKNTFGLSNELASRVAAVVGGHHGVFPRSDEVRWLALSEVGTRGWADARVELAKALANVIDVPSQAPLGVLSNTVAMTLAGLVSVADWIGSNETYFPYELPVDLSLYSDAAKKRARDAIDKLAWTGSLPPEAQSFAALFPTLEPRPVQRAAEALAGNLNGPSMVIIEAPTGEGKTEAAIYLADNAGMVHGERGCYFALPTQATSNQMFGRVRDFLSHRYRGDTVQLQLLHGHAALSAEFDVLKRNAFKVFEPRGIWDESYRGQDLPNVVAAEWFTHRKRGLLAPFGVGTIDQALLAILQTKHVFVRLFGLAHKPVILDEVHAYDTYMSTLLERLLEWLAALGSCVVLLSATLPRARRERLVNAYAKGLGRSELALLGAAYPRVSWVSKTAQGATHVETSEQSTKKVQLEWVDGDLSKIAGGAFELGTRLKTALEHGGCAAVICNTVDRAQQMYRALKPYFSGQADDGLPELDLLHARFIFQEREEREKRSEVRFGKPGGKVHLPDGLTGEVRRPKKAVLVATQVIEQSLDLDFDLMVTDLAPADLVLQRAGRLHRHERPRPAGLDTPRLWVCRPQEKDGVPKFDSGTEAIYDAHVLLRSWLVLKVLGVIHVPGDVEEIVEAVYDDGPCPEGLPAAVRDVWKDTGQKLAEKRAKHEALASQFRILPPDHSDDILEDFNRELEEDDPTVHHSIQALTRLGDPSLNVVVPDSQQLLHLEAKPDMAQVKELLGRSLTISHRCLVRLLLRQEVPKGWGQVPLLRYHRLLHLGEGSIILGGYRLELDANLGLVIDRLEQEVDDA